MARLLFIWEQGSNLGHLSLLKMPISVALEMGHEVFLAARELQDVKSVLGDMPIAYLQAPVQRSENGAVAADPNQFLSYTHLLSKQVFPAEDTLEILLRSWKILFALVRPDAVLFEHSPIALLAARSHQFQKILVGWGFTVPPIPKHGGEPFAPFPTTPSTPETRAALLNDDAALLSKLNRVLAKVGDATMLHVQDLYAQADNTLLMTWPEIDAFGPREGQRYLGIESIHVDRAPVWPAGEGPRVFGYLQMFPALEQLVNDLLAASVRALLVVRNAPAAVVQACAGGRVQITTDILDMRRVVQEADWVISHGNHSTVATVCAAGVPQLLIPRHQEQLFQSLKLVQQGCAAMVFQDQTAFSNAIQVMLTQPALKTNAKRLQSAMTPFTAMGGREMVREVLSCAYCASGEVLLK